MPGNKTGRLLEGDMLVGLSAVFIGLCALAVSLYETSLMRAEQRAEVLPIVELSRSYYANPDAGPGAWRLLTHAENVGIGPAQIRDFRVTVDGKAVASWREAVHELLGRDVDVSYGQSSINGRTLPPDRVVRMFELDDSELVAEVLEEFGRLDYTACYCSVFDECWTTSYSAFGASTPVESCERSELSFTE